MDNMTVIGPNELSIIDTALVPGILGTNSMPKGPSKC